MVIIDGINCLNIIGLWNKCQISESTSIHPLSYKYIIILMLPSITNCLRILLQIELYFTFISELLLFMSLFVLSI